MKDFALFLILFFFPLALGGLFAQNGNTPGPASQELKPLLKKLDVAQKLQLLEYLRYSGADLDWEVRQTYEQLSPEKRKRVLEYADMLQKGIGPQEKTTVRWSPDTLFFGDIDEGIILLDSFKVTNTGTNPYFIREVKTSCDCTVVRFPQFPVMPGETAVIRVEFDSIQKAGRTQPGIIFYDNSKPNARSILYLDGNVVPKVKPKNSGN